MVDPLILIELFLGIQEPLLLLGKNRAHVAAVGFVSRYLNGTLPYNRK